MTQIQEQQRIIFSEDSSPADVAAANIQLEKLMSEYEKCPEVLAMKEEKRRNNERLNNAALEKGIKIYILLFPRLCFVVQ